MILSFSVFKDKLESGEKCQTIRRFSPKQYQRFLNTWKKRETTGRYNLYWHNPRNGGVRIKDVVPSDKPFVIQFHEYQTGMEEIRDEIGVDMIMENGDHIWINANELAHLDGFPHKYEMFRWFSNQYGDAMFTEKFMVIRWHP